MVSRAPLRHARLPSDLDDVLRCPACRSRLERHRAQYNCRECGAVYSFVGEVPVLLDPSRSLYSVPAGSPGRLTLPERFLRLLERAVPDPSRNVKGLENLKLLGAHLDARHAGRRARVLVIGGQILGDGLETLLHRESIDLVETDVTMGARTALVCDAHDLPFADEAFDAVVIQEVLPSVSDPQRCVAEIDRVLARDGFVYAENAFMQQAWGGRFDFTRWTLVGHRRLFRAFEEIRSGPVCGPGMALAWAWDYFLASFPTSRAARRAVRAFAHITGFWLKYFDSFLVSRPGALDAASSFFFLGRKTGRIATDRESVESYKGLTGTASRSGVTLQTRNVRPERDKGQPERQQIPAPAPPLPKGGRFYPEDSEDLLA